MGTTGAEHNLTWVWLIAGLALMIALFAIMPSVRLGWPPTKMKWIPPRAWSPGAFVWYQVAWLVACAVIVLALASPQPLVAAPHEWPAWTRVLSPWVGLGGAIGGATISLVGVSRHAQHWDGARFAFFHLVRPLLGLITGSVAVLIIIFVINGFSGGAAASATPGATPGAGTAVTLDPTKPFSPSAHAFMFIIAFVVGYREESFRELVKRVADLILTTAKDPKDDPFTIGFLPPSVSLYAAAGATATQLAYLANTTDKSIDADIVVTVEPADAGFTVAPAAARGIPAGGGVPFTITWTAPDPVTERTAALTALVGTRQFTLTLRGGPPASSPANPPAANPPAAAPTTPTAAASS